MANNPIPNFTAAIALTGAEELFAVQGGVSVRLTAQQIINLVSLAQLTAILDALPTSDPHIVGALWWNNNVLNRSTG